MNQPACDLIGAIAGRFPAGRREDVVLYLEAAAGRAPDPYSGPAERRETARRIAAGRRLVLGLVERGEITEAKLLRETGLDL